MSDRSADELDINQHDHSGRGSASAHGETTNKSSFLGFYDTMWNSWIDAPVTWFRKTIVEPNRKQSYPWYHESFKRVPTIDQCYTDDPLCIYEADQQYRRDRLVDDSILTILRYRMDDCVREEFPDQERCEPLRDYYEAASAAWFAKYGDLGAVHNVKTCYMKQKHRLLWERRHGKVGTGMKHKDNEISADGHDH